jgi:hypothetical protein
MRFEYGGNATLRCEIWLKEIGCRNHNFTRLIRFARLKLSVLIEIHLAKMTYHN